MDEESKKSIRQAMKDLDVLPREDVLESVVSMCSALGFANRIICAKEMGDDRFKYLEHLDKIIVPTITLLLLLVAREGTDVVRVFDLIGIQMRQYGTDTEVES